MANKICKYCNKEFITWQSRVAHENFCKANPNKLESYLTTYRKEHSAWNKGLKRKNGIHGWCYGKNKDNDERLMKLSLARMGDNNPSSYKNRPDRSLDIKKQSETMKQKILEGTYTPNTENRLCHKLFVYDNKKFRSSWEVIFYYFHKDFEYETKRIKYILNNEEHIYISDFYDPITNTIYEIKPDRMMYNIQKEKYEVIKNECINQGYNFIHCGDDWKNSIVLENTDINKDIIKKFNN